ncbi:hypothetical protein Pint_29765 [Pistacia integerrima]|uniref:Uncharacterized protein n=1 Tax=Pistacia integerrima TaxID=434235 RepID=A0ACC0X1J6_9ROSI|nr:hypothetical protein Pint_29765 [Pistacia integerrima]
MSYLFPKEVAQINILSKRWNQLRITFPVFDFDETYFLTEDESDPITSVVEENRLALRLKEFMEFVDTSLLRFCDLKFCMHKFRLFISVLYVEELVPYIDKWIRLAAEKEVKELDLDILIESDTMDTPYTLPQTIFSARSVITLRLVNCKLENISDTIRSNSLRKLLLDEVFINEDMVQKLSSECPLLEEMSFTECWGLKRLCVFKALKLKIMSVSLYRIESIRIESVEIVLLNLQELCLRFGTVRTPRVFNIVGCLQLKKLFFGGVSLMDQQFHYFISSFPLLEDLILEYCHFLERITISSNQLKKFGLSSCLSMEALDLDTPNLLSFTYKDSPIPTSRINALCPWQVKFDTDFTFDTQSCLKLREFLGVSNQIKDLKIDATPTVVCV